MNPPCSVDFVELQRHLDIAQANLALLSVCTDLTQRKLGDSNPRYENSYGSLANCWFQPLTQTSIAAGHVPPGHLLSNAGAKVMQKNYLSKLFRTFFHPRKIFVERNAPHHITRVS